MNPQVPQMMICHFSQTKIIRLIRFHLFIILFLLTTVSYTQEFIGMGTRWNDTFKEWILYTYDEGEEGELQLTWAFNDDWTSWQYSLLESNGTIKQKWKNNPNEWELRGDNFIVTARTVWPNNFSEWRISDDQCTFTLRSRYGNVFEEWESRDDECGQWRAYTTYEGDPRDWVIESEFSHDSAFQLSMMAAFITIFHSTPKL
jgi:hypothetical protein